MLFIFMICVMCGYIIGIVVGSMYSVGNAMIAFTRALGVTSATATVTTWFDRLAGMGLFALLGWFVIDFIRRRYEAKWSSV